MSSTKANESYRIEDEPEWLQKLLDRNSPFQPDAFDEPVKEEKPAAAAPTGKPKIDLRKFITGKGVKYTCTMCEGEYESSQVKDWWTKPGNRRGKTPVPICPLCGNAGAIYGWGHEFSERRKMGEEIRKKEEESARKLRESREKEGGENIERRECDSCNERLFPKRH